MYIVNMDMILIICLIYLAISRQNSLLSYVKPKDYSIGEPVDLLVNKLSSVNTQLAFDYYSLPFCVTGPIKTYEKSLGEILTGDVIRSSFYQLNVLENIECRRICVKTYEIDELKQFRTAINDELLVNMIIDGLPVAMVIYSNVAKDGFYYKIGYNVGVNNEQTGRYILHNHLQFKIRYHKNRDGNTIRIVGAEVLPSSRKDCLSANSDYVTINSDTQTQVAWTYSVTWEEDLYIQWASRWDVYTRINPNEKIQWYSLVNSILIVIFLSSVVAMIMIRVLKKDISKYNEFNREEAIEETGWKLLHADVFRTPDYPLALSIFVGTGIHVLCLAVCIMVFSILGFISTTRRGSILTASVIFFVALSSVSSYFAAKLCIMFGFRHWKSLVFLSSSFLPSIIGSIVIFINILAWNANSTIAIPISVLLLFTVMWIGISIPLSFFGAFFGFRSQRWDYPTRTNQIRREIPNQPIHMNPIVSCLLSGLIPFGTIFLELYIVFSSIWLNRIFYMFTFFFLVFTVLLITTVEISIVITYFRLSNENYRWWWPAFFSTGSSGLFLFLYSIGYGHTTLHLEFFVSRVIYYGYSFLLSLMFTLLTGSVGFFASFYFVRVIYSSIKVD